MRIALVLLAAVLPQTALPTTGAAQTYLVVVTGLGGEPRYQAAFREWGGTLVATARERFGLPDEHIVFLTESPQSDPLDGSRSTKENVEAALQRFASQAEPDALVVVVLIGHGSSVGGAARINLPGPDMSAEDFAALLARFPSQTIVFANLASASGDFLPLLAGERRVIITATKSGLERNETIFAGHFVQAFAAEGADTDKNARVSLLEAFDYARQEVARTYESENRLLTEHALLDDDGDGEGGGENDGLFASRVFLDADAGRAQEMTADPELAALYRQRRDLETQVAALRARREEMAQDAYEAELERLLLELARTSRAIREREGRTSR